MHSYPAWIEPIVAAAWNASTTLGIACASGRLKRESGMANSLQYCARFVGLFKGSLSDTRSQNTTGFPVRWFL